MTAGRRVTYAALEAAVSATTGYFRERGLSPGDTAALDMSDPLEHLVSALALARLGAGQIVFTEADSPRQREHFSKLLGIAATIGIKRTGAAAVTPVIEPPFRDPVEFLTLEPCPFAAAHGADLPFLYARTSGTGTGISKLGLITHGLAGPRIAGKGHELPAGPGTRYLSLGDLSFNSVKTRAFHCLFSGGCLVLLRKRADPQSVFAAISGYNVDYLACAPAQASRLMEYCRETNKQIHGLKALRLGSSHVPQTLREELQNRLTPNLFIAFGVTETGTVSIATPDMIRNTAGSVGRPLPGIKAEVIGEDGQTLPARRVGRLRVGSPGMLSGYIDAPEDCLEDFRDGWFFTGDRAEFTDDGELIHHGRLEDTITVDGVKMNAVQFENILLRHPGVREAAVFSVPGPDGGDIPIAAVVVRGSTTETGVFSYCRDRLGARAPQEILILDSLPRNPSGKVSIPALREIWRAREDSNL